MESLNFDWASCSSSLSKRVLHLAQTGIFSRSYFCTRFLTPHPGQGNIINGYSAIWHHNKQRVKLKPTRPSLLCKITLLTIKHHPLAWKIKSRWYYSSCLGFACYFSLLSRRFSLPLCWLSWDFWSTYLPLDQEEDCISRIIFRVQVGPTAHLANPRMMT